MKTISRNEKNSIVAIILFEIGFIVKFDIVGEISLSELFLLVYFLRDIIRSISKRDKKQLLWYDKDFNYVKILYLLLLGWQIISEFFVGNTVANSCKGIAVSISSFCHLYFLIKLFGRSRRAIVYAVIGIVFQYLLAGPEFEGTTEGALDGEDVAYFKFYLAPIISYATLALSGFLDRKFISFLAILIGSIIIVIGARSSGGVLALAGLITYIFSSNKTINTSKIVRLSVFTLLLSYSAYVLYINQALEGNITNGNNEKIMKMKINPYNPLNLMLIGRSDSFVPLIAFMNKPVFGYGAWAEDPGMIYHYLQDELIDYDRGDKEFNNTRIPGHSVLFGMAMYNGVGSFLVLIFLFTFFIKRGAKCLLCRDNFQLIYTWFLIMMIWHLLFSPISHFRLSLPLYMACIFSTYKYYYIGNKNNKNCIL